MEQLVRVQIEFDAHHQLVGDDPDRPRCSRSHGHRWSVSVEKRGRDLGLEEDLADLVREWHDRSLNEMLPRLNTSPEQLALVVMERLLLAHPTIVEVAVGDGRLTALVRNVPR